MPFPLVALLFAGLSFITQSLLRPRNRVTAPKAAGLSEFSFPTNEEARPIPYIAGTVKLAPNITYFDDLSTTPITKFIRTSILGFGTRAPLGFRYNVGIEFGLCFGPGVRLKKLTIDDKELYAGDLYGAPATTTILKESLFGGEGEDGDGGVNVILDFYEGNSVQVANPYMVTRYARQNGHRDVAYAVWRGPSGGSIYVGGQYVSGGGYLGKTPQLRPVNFYLERLPDYLGSGIKNIASDANPANILYELTLNRLYGGGLSAAKLDAPAFTAAANTLYNEGLGCSVQWERTESIDNVIQQLVNVADAALYTDLKTGLVTIKLIRDDYDPEDLLIFNDDDVLEIQDFSRGSWQETKNELRLNFVNRAEDYKIKPAFAQDLANQMIRNATDPEVIDYTSTVVVTQPALAQKLAYRELRAVALPLARATLVTNRKGAALVPGSVFRWTTSRIDPAFTNKVMRVIRANYGRLGDSRVTVDVVEDVFALGGTIYLPPPSAQGQLSLTTPLVANPIYVNEQPLFFSGEEFRPWSLVRQPSGSHITWDLHISDNAGANYSLKEASAIYTPVGSLQLDYPQTGAVFDTVGFALNNIQGMENVFGASASDVLNGAGMILFEDTGEIAAFEGITYDSVTGRYTLSNIWRALLDTPPSAHLAGTRVWIVGFGQSRTDAAYLSGQALKLKHLTRNGRGELPLADATAYDWVIAQRSLRPYPPSYLRVQGSYTQVNVQDDITLTWNHRDRFQQPPIVKQDAASVGPEVGVTYRVEVLAGATVIHTETGISGTSYVWTEAAEAVIGGGSLYTDLTFRVSAVRAGLNSYYKYIRAVHRTDGTIYPPTGSGYGGSGYGEVYGG